MSTKYLGNSGLNLESAHDLFQSFYDTVYSWAMKVSEWKMSTQKDDDSKGECAVYVNPLRDRQNEAGADLESGVRTTTNVKKYTFSPTKSRIFARKSISEAVNETSNLSETPGTIESRDDVKDDDEGEVSFAFGRCMRIVLYHAFYPLALPIIYFLEGRQYLGSVSSPTYAHIIQPCRHSLSVRR